MDDFCPTLGKVRHTTEAAASRQLRSLKKRKSYDGEVFQCNSCLGWHVGKKKPPADILQLEQPAVVSACTRWLEGAAGTLHQVGAAEGTELRLRLESAFLAGMDAALQIVNGNPKRRDRR